MSHRLNAPPANGSPGAYALIRKRADVAGEIEKAQADLRRLRNALDHIDFAIHLFDPDYEIESIRNVPKLTYTFRGQSTQAILDCLRESTGPMSTEQVARYVIAYRGLDPEELAVRRLFRTRVGSVIGYLAKKGLVRCVEKVGKMNNWELVPLEG